MEILLHSAQFYYDPHFPKSSACGIFCPQFPQRPLLLHALYRFFHIHCTNKNDRLYVRATEKQTLLNSMDLFEESSDVGKAGRVYCSQLHIYCASCVMRRHPFLPTSQAKVHGQQERFYGALAYSGVCAASTLIVVCTPLCPQHLLM